MDMQKERKSDKQKRPGWVRALEILLRTGHIGTTGVVFGAAVFAIPFARLIPWHQMAIATGAGLVVLGICQSRHWPYQLRGVMAIGHVVLFGLVRLFPDYRVQLLATVLVIGAIGSHMPSGIRHWSLLHGRRID